MEESIGWKWVGEEHRQAEDGHLEEEHPEGHKENGAHHEGDKAPLEEWGLAEKEGHREH